MTSTIPVNMIDDVPHNKFWVREDWSDKMCGMIPS